MTTITIPTNAITFSAVLLAAGSSSRMQGEFKQLLPVPTPEGIQPLVRVTAQAILASKPAEVVVVTGHRGREVMDVTAGLTALQAPCTAVMICLADMVLLEPNDYSALAKVFADLPRDAILVPHHQGTRGNPVTFAASRVPEVLSGAVNPGCRKLIADHPQDVVCYEFDHDRYTTDTDTPDDYARIRSRLANKSRPVAA
jgi:molybdenum cofactor cytidylyltransferase